MKVIGTGAPRMLTLRLEPCELDVLRDELEQRRSALVEVAAQSRQRAEIERPALPGVGGRPDLALEDRYDELLLVCQLFDELRRPAPDDGPREMVGPTWLLGPVIRGAVDEAIERLAQAVAEFREDRGHPTREELCGTLATAAAWVQTLIGLDRGSRAAPPVTLRRAGAGHWRSSR